MNRKEAQSGTVGLGGVSIFCILIVCCLTAFSVLAMVSASADWRLSLRNASFVSEYYEADSLAETVLSELMLAWSDADTIVDPSELLRVLQDAAMQDPTVEQVEDEFIISFYLPIGSGIQRLFVQVCLKPALYTRRIDRIEWYMETDDTDEEYDLTLPVWQGD